MGTLRAGLRRWHRWAGLSAAAFLVLLALSGLALNHSEALGLADRAVEHPWVLSLFGVETPAPSVTFAVDGGHVTRLGERLYLNARAVTTVDAPLVGALAQPRYVVAALPARLVLFTREGRLVESLGAAAGVPTPITRIGEAADGALMLSGPAGVHAADLEALRWTPAPGARVRWSAPTTPPPALEHALAEAWRGKGLSLERVLLALHSGRIAGRWGVLVMDLVGLVCLALAGTGVWIWLRQRRRA